MRGLYILAFALMTALAGACVSTPAPAGAQAGAQAQARVPQLVFLIDYSPGPAWQAGVAMNRQALGPHAAYWTRLAREGRAIAAGPYLDVEGGMAMVMAANVEQARAIVAADPAVTSGVFAATLRAWSPRIRGAGELPR